MPRVAIIGGGSAGTCWAARFSLMGWDVVIHPESSDYVAQVDETFERASRALPSLSDATLPTAGQITHEPSLAKAVAGVHWVVLSPSGSISQTQATVAQVQDACDFQTIIAVTSNTFPLAALQSDAAYPEQIITAQGTDPVYLLPLVRLITSDANPPDLIRRAEDTLTGLGMVPLDPSNSPEVDPETAQVLSSHRAVEVVAASIADGADRDRLLVTLLRGLISCDHCIGVRLKAHDGSLYTVPDTLDAVDDLSQPVLTLARAVPMDWTDYNGHMTEARYLHAFGEATDRMMILVGCTPDYVAAGHSFFTAETHIRHLDEVVEGTRIHIDTQIIAGAGKKMHVFHRMWGGDRLLATGEHMLIHVSLTTRAACAPDARVAGPLTRIADAHADLPPPDGMGRAVGRK